MQSRDFCYWLQGYFEITDQRGYDTLSPAQLQTIKKHLDLVFAHEIDPAMGGTSHQQALNSIHGTPGPGGLVARC